MCVPCEVYGHVAWDANKWTKIILESHCLSGQRYSLIKGK